MIPKKDLHALIHALDKHEKRYFRLFASRYTVTGKKNHIRVFDLIDKQTVYNEALLKKELEQAGVAARHLPFIKNYLLNLIRDCLHQYYSGFNHKAEMRKYFTLAEVLYYKGLYEQCLEMVLKAKKLAEAGDNHIYLLESYQWLRKMVNVGKFISSMEGRHDGGNWLSWEMQAVRALERSVRMQNLGMQVYLQMVKYGKTRRSSELKQTVRTLRHPLLRLPSRAAGIGVRINYYFTWAVYYRLKGDFLSCYRLNRELVSLLEEFPSTLYEAPDRYLGSLANLSMACRELKRFDELPGIISRLKTIAEHIPPGLRKGYLTRVYYHVYSMELEMSYMRAEYKKGILLIPEILQWLQSSAGKINKIDEISFLYIVAHVYFGAGDHASSLQWLNNLLNDPEIGLREDLRCFAGILRLIVHFELKHYDVLPYAVRSTYQYLYKRKRLFGFERCVLGFLQKKLPALPSERELMPAFRELQKQLLIVTKDPYEKRALDYFDFNSWLEAKISGKPFAEIVRKKAMEGRH